MRLHPRKKLKRHHQSWHVSNCAPRRLYGLSCACLIGVASVSFVLSYLLARNPLTIQGNGLKQNKKPHLASSWTVLVEALQNVTNTTLQGLGGPLTMNQEFVLEHGYPMHWDSCTVPDTLFQVMQAKPRPLGITIFGGSLSARAGENCQASKDIQHGRYSNQLQDLLDSTNDTSASSRLFKVHNMAQGGVDSVWFGLHMDILLDPNRTDLLIWEFAVNDHHNSGADWGNGANPQTHRQKLDFWFRSVHRIYRHNSSSSGPPPPILLLYLWEYGVGLRPGMHLHSTQKGLQSSVFTDSWSLIQQYRDLGWNIQVVNVGASIDRQKFVSNPKLLLDDLHHPSCGGGRIIANMLQHAIYSNIASCNMTSALLDDIRNKEHQSSVLPSLPPLPVNPTTELGERLVQDHNNNNMRISSWTNWLPNTGTSSLRMGHNSTIVLEPMVQNINPAAVLETRSDRKNSYIIPLCDDDDDDATGGRPGPLTFHLLEPNLRWLGLDLSHGGVNVTINSNPPFSAQPNGKATSGLEWIFTWIQIKSTFSNYTVSFCKLQTNSEVFLHGLVAMMEEANEENGLQEDADS